MRPARLLVAVVAVASSLLPASSPAQSPAAGAEPPGPARVEVFSPAGAVKNVRQARARFSEAMVPFGDPRAADGVFDVACPEPGAPRWVDSRDWVYDFVGDLPAGVQCTFRLKPGLVTLAGAPVGGAQEFGFSTGGPAIRLALPRAGTSWVDEEQAFVLGLDAAAAEESVLERAWFRVEGIVDRVGVAIVTGPARAAILESQGAAVPPGPVLVVQARQRFPSGARVALVWGAGIGTAGGVATTEDQSLEFQVRRAFELTFRCERERRDAACIPVTPMRVDFSAPVPAEQARRLALVGPGGRRWRAEPREAQAALRYSVTFEGPFPETSAFTVEVPPDLTDDAGRPAVNAGRFPLTVKTAEFPPLAKFAARFGIVERADAVLPVTLRRLEPGVRAAVARVDRAGRGRLEDWLDRVRAAVLRIPPEYSADIQRWLVRVGEATRERSVFGSRAGKAMTLAKPNGADAFEVVGIPLGRPGLYIVELQSARLGAALLEGRRPMYVATAALVTNLSVHFKWGAPNALVWVTSLDAGRPVAGARVTIQDCLGTVRWRGETGAEGLARVSGLPGRNDLPRCGPMVVGGDFRQAHALRGLNEGLLVVAQTHDDLSFVHSSWGDGIEPWRFGLRAPDFRGPVAVHTILDRPLFRAGETVHMKHVLRLQTAGGLAAVPAPHRPTHVSIRHLGSDQKYDLPLEWDGAGIAESTWTIPRAARLGGYSVVLVGGAPMSRRREAETITIERASAGFRVEEFRLPVMRAVLRAPAAPPVDAAEVPLDLAVAYLAGGPARRLPVTFRAQIQPRVVAGIDGFEDFVFANGLVSEGMTRRALGEEEDDEGGPRLAPASTPAVHQRDQLTLDEAGTARVTVERLPRAAAPRDLLAELEFRDPAGEVQTAATRVPLWPASRLVGIRPETGEVFGETVKAQIAVVDLAGKPVRDAPVYVDAFERRLYSHRKRLVGGFYAYEHVQEIRRIGELCEGTTDAGGLFVCEAPAPAPGQLVLQASTVDDAWRVSSAHQDVWVVDPDAAWWFDVRDGDRMDVLPERRRYEPGETARLQVRMPFRKATALVTTEREGVMDAKVVELAGGSPTVEVRVEGGHAPNVFVSVLAVRGRVGGAQPGAVVDLGRPAFRLGVAEIAVGWRAHELKVAVQPARAAYRVRDTAAVRIVVRTADGVAPPPGSEVAVAAVDEALLELLPNPTWSLLEAMMRRRGYGLTTASAQMHVVGKRHFGLKALPAGGGGGRQTTRELFDTLLAWRGRVPLDERGEATLDIPLNDSLTSFRIVAVATGAAGLFGTGAASIRATQDLMVLPGVAPLVREGDHAAAEVTVRNATERAMEVTASARVDGLPDALAPRTLRLAPGEARVVAWDVAVPLGVPALRYAIEAAERGGAIDRVRVTQRVIEAVPVRTLQATLAQSEGPGRPVRQTVERPADALPGRGGVRVGLRSTLLAGAEPLREWMRRYPYRCLEQDVSRAVALREPELWRDVAGTLAAHLDGDGLLKYFPTLRQGSDVLSAYVLSVAHEAGWEVPESVRDSVTAALRKFVEGRIVRGSPVPSPDLTLRKLAALEALARYGRADAALVSTIAIEPNLWPTSGVLDWWSLLRRVDGIPRRAERLREVESIVRARLDVQGTVMGFSTERSDGLWWLMVSNDVNAVRLILALLEAGLWRDDLPRLVQGALARQRRGAWDLTVANAWGALALERFSRELERTPVSGVSVATLAGAARRVEWSPPARGAAVSFAWPSGREELAVEHEGAGRPWITVESQAAVPLARPLSAGYRITRTLLPIERRDPGRWSRGDIVRVRLEIEAQADMTWVVVDDPIPGGASHLGRGLGRESAIAAGGERGAGSAWPAYEERSFDALRAYYRWVPKGAFTLEYTVRLNQSGRFLLPPTRVEALYAPEMFGALPNAPLEVAP